MKRKGFTLVELLAIIVILGIIALIAVPTVKKIMDEAKKKAFINSAYGIIKSGDLYYSRKDMLDEIEGRTTFNFPDDISGLEFDGKAPESGSMVINEDGDIALAITDEKYCIKKAYVDKDITITEDPDNCYNPAFPNVLAQVATTNEALGVTRVYNCVKKEKCPVGTEFAIKVNDAETYKFYVINDDGNEVTLIMDANLGETIGWYSNVADNSKGPLTIISKLSELTDEEWTNIPEREYTYKDDGGGNKYSSFNVNAKARLLTYTEATKLGCSKEVNSQSCPKWLKNNFWLSAAAESNNVGAWVYFGTYLSLAGNTGDKFYIKPVITISK